jgi:hypothetical protein
LSLGGCFRPTLELFAEGFECWVFTDWLDLGVFQKPATLPIGPG